MVFQDPYASLNPRRRVRDLIAEPLRVHTHDAEAEIERSALRELLDLVGLKPDHAKRFPARILRRPAPAHRHRPRLALNPELIVADEPVSALDVSVQAQIVNLLADLQERLSLTYVFIAHDLSVVRQVSTRIAVMYLGSIVEMGPTETSSRGPPTPTPRR